MKKVSGIFSLLVLLLISSSAFAGDPMLEDMVANFSSPIFIFFNFALALFLVVAQWKILTKAGEPGWVALVPIYNIYVMLKIAGKPGWWIILWLVPFANVVVAILMNIGLARNFGQSDGFAIGLILLPYIFFPVLAFGDSQYSPVVPTV